MPLIGLMGGAFDPIHHGHLRAALETQHMLDLDAVWLIPVGQPVHRAPPRGSGLQRMHMVQCALDDLRMPQLVSSDIEIQRPGASYTADTLRELTRRHPDHTWCLILGTDAFASLHTWEDPEAIHRMAHVVVVARAGYPSTQALPLGPPLRHTLRTQRTGLVVRVDTTPLAIASSAIRSMCQQRMPLACLVPPSVAQYIASESLYTSSGDHDTCPT